MIDFAHNRTSHDTALLGTTSVIEVRGMTRRFGGLIAVNHVSFSVAEGEIFGLIGPNGAGKTTLFNLITGLTPPSSGRLVYQGEDITGLRPYQIAARGIARTFQNIRLFSDLSVLANVMIARHVHTCSGVLPGVFGLPSARREERALMSRPRLLLLDEPSLGLAPLVVREIFAIVRELSAAGVTILLVEQNAHLALQHADRGYVLEAGQLTISGKASELLVDDRVRQAYLG